MSSRDISGTILRACFGAVYKKTTPSKILTFVLDEMASAQRDMDITGDMDSHFYYEGMVDAFEMVAWQIAPLKQDKEETYYDLLSKVFTPKAKAA